MPLTAPFLAQPPRPAAVPAEALARFEVPEGEREFKGEADDRKGLLEFRQGALLLSARLSRVLGRAALSAAVPGYCSAAADARPCTARSPAPCHRASRQKLQARVKELEKAKKAFLEGERAKRDKAAKEEGKGAKVSACWVGGSWCVGRARRDAIVEHTAGGGSGLPQGLPRPCATPLTSRPWSLNPPQAVETAFRKAERCLEHERRATETAEKAAAAAEKKLEK